MPLAKQETVLSHLPLNETVLLSCLADFGTLTPRHKLSDLDSITADVIDAQSELLDKIPTHYERNTPTGDKFLIETVSFILDDGKIISDVVDQTLDTYIDEPGEIPFYQSGKSIKRTLRHYPHTKHIVIHTSTFNGITEETPNQPIETSTLQILTLK